MKKILITGAGSYIGTALGRYLAQWPERYIVDTVDMIDGSWRERSFAGYDCVYHVAGIAHADTGAVSDERKKLYYSVNTDLAIETAKYYGIDNETAKKYASDILTTVKRNWELVAAKCGLGRGEIENMRPAFRESEKRADNL